MKGIAPELNRLGLTVRGTSGEGSGAEGDLFQISNEVTLGLSEGEILSAVEKAVRIMVEFELKERDRMKVEEGVSLRDRVMRAYGVLTNCCMIDMQEFMKRAADIKLGVALGYFESENPPEETIATLDDLIVAMRPANIMRLSGAPLSEQEQSVYRAEYAKKAIRSAGLFA